MSEPYYAFVLFALVATITPGGATTLATASGSQFGYLRSIPLMLGIALGLAALTASSATGLATVIQAIPALSVVLKILGSAYLLCLAIRIGTAGAPKSAAGRATPVGFLGGVLLLLVNPKGWTMALGAAASFSTVAPDPLRLAAVMGATFALAAIVSLSLWCLGGAILARTLSTERQWLILNVSLAVLLAASIIPIWLG